MKVLKFKRGQIWWYRTGDNYNGSVQGKTRPVIIMSNDIANAKSPCLIAIPCTTQEKREMVTHVKFYIDTTPNTALAENLMSVSTEKLGEYIGEVDKELLTQLEEAAKIAIGLVEPPKIKIEEEPIIIEEPTITVEQIQLNDDVQVETKRGRKSKYDNDYMIRYLADHKNHTIAYMMKKYNEKSARAVSDKAYRFKKVLNGEDYK